MNFTTKIPISKYASSIDYNSKIISLGSCFAENMGEKFDYFKFQSTTNPFGIVFNPVSIERLISRIVNQELFAEKDVFFHNERWHCFEVHSDLSYSDKDVFLQNLNEIIVLVYSQIMELTHCVITYGTSWVYRNKETNEIVANCHKVAQNQFNKEILSVETIEKSIEDAIQLIQKINPKCNFIFTISPVRHIKDGFVENQLSKAHLISGLQSAIFGLSSANYFPSYEILMDELRDYRFYADDMLHPSQAAIDYIWINFFENYVEEKEFATMQQVCDIQKALHHKPFNFNSEVHRRFIEKTNQKISALVSKYPQIKF